MTPQLYEIRHAVSGKVYLKDATHDSVRTFWDHWHPTEQSTRKIDGVIVIFVTLNEAHA